MADPNNSLFAEQEISDVLDISEDDKITQFLTFAIDELFFGASVEYVVETITNHVITPLPMVPNYVSGILNLRGQVIPVIDIRLRLGRSVHDDSSIIVLDVDGTQIGIQVDYVVQMVEILKENILPVPAHNTQKLVSGMCSLHDGTTMMVLDCALLVEP
jgi:purine-binding chemotaxis protein CheW